MRNEAMFSYVDALSYVNSLINYERKKDYSYGRRSFNLERMNHLLTLLGRPHQSLKVIHIAGTKGKGSTAAITSSILTAANLKVGLYTSPHLLTPRERIRIGSSLIGEEEFAYFLSKIKSKVRASYLEPTFFEVYTALALLYFFHQKVDLAVLEVGLGGRLDATNVVRPLVGIITQISFDHMDKLGCSLTSIAREKAGIIKEGINVVSSPQEDIASSVIEKVCRERKARLYQVGKEINFRLLDTSLDGQRFQVQTTTRDYPCLFLPLMGQHQIINAATAIGAVDLLGSSKIFIPKKAVIEGVRKTQWPARIQVISRNPLLIVDCAHNGASAWALSKCLQEFFPEKRIILVLAILQNKDVKGIGRALFPLAETVILTRAESPRSMEPQEIKTILSEYCSGKTIIAENTREALRYSLGLAKRESLICFAGSSYLAGEVLALVNKSSKLPPKKKERGAKSCLRV
jgi:dihydrofolate synthase/folylpolyglutamate synthase